MLVPLGPTTTSQAVNQMNAASMRGVPSVASRPVVRDAMIWVPGRVVRLPGEGVVTVPGHWERRLPGTREVHVPPLTVRNSLRPNRRWQRATRRDRELSSRS